MTFGQENAPVSIQDKRSISFEHIRQLKDGALLVRLISDRKKIEALEQQSKAYPNDKKIAGKLEKAKVDRNEFNLNWIAELKANYYFSKLYFFYDYDSKLVNSNVRSGYFLNDNLDVDKEIKVEEPYIYILSEGTAGESGIAAFMMYDQNLKILEKPFPYYFKKNNFWKVLFGVFDSKSPRHRDLDILATEINEVFIEYYKKSFL